MRYFILLLVLLFVFSANLCVLGQVVVADSVSAADAGVNRDRGTEMLDQIKALLKERYYDKSFHGIDLEARFKAAKERIKGMSQNRQIFRVIAQTVMDFDDSHTLFVPPGRHLRVEYGFTTQMIGNDCFVTDVISGTDAEAKGLKPGDIIRSIAGITPDRQNLWQIEYLLYALDPMPAVQIKVKGPDQTERSLTIASKFKTPEELKKEAEKKKKEVKETPYVCARFDNGAVACKLRTFEVEKKDIDAMMSMIAGSNKFILDLRGNGGGFVSIEEYLTGYFFDHDVKIATMVSRDKTKDHLGKTLKEKVYKGDLVILIDSDSASAAEVFARSMQIEKRATVIGDVSAGAVMASNFITMANQRGVEDYATYSFFAMNITVADLIMSDGNRLEKVGVVPDQIVLPTPIAIRDRLDPVLSIAATRLGSKLSVEQASDLHFLLKKPETAGSDKANAKTSDDK